MTGDAFTIAVAQARDIDDVAELFRAYEAHIGVDLSYQGFADELATLPGKYAPPRGQLLIARNVAGAAIGCVALRPMQAPGCCEMKRLFVSHARPRPRPRPRARRGDHRRSAKTRLRRAPARHAVVDARSDRALSKARLRADRAVLRGARGHAVHGAIIAAMTFQDHFSGHATTYREARPLYPPALFDWLARAGAGARCSSWDAGCGNGQASVALAERFARVLRDRSEREPDRERRSAAEHRVPRRARRSSARCRRRAPISSPSRRRCTGSISRASSPKSARVLKPGGVFAAWAYADCRVTPAVDALKDRVYVDLTGPYWPPERELCRCGLPHDPVSVRRRLRRSRKSPRRAFEMRVDWDAAQFLAYLRSWSATQRYIKANGSDPVAMVEADISRRVGRSRGTARRCAGIFMCAAGGCASSLAGANRACPRCPSQRESHHRARRALIRDARAMPGCVRRSSQRSSSMRRASSVPSGPER